MGKTRHDKHGNVETAVECSACRKIVYWEPPSIFGNARAVYSLCDECFEKESERRKR